jgi:hypothetical protein
MAKAVSNTKYYSFEGKVEWCKVYTPDEFRGAVRWTLDFFPKDEDELKKIKDSGIQKVIKDKGNGPQLNFSRSTTKLMKGKIVHFTPPQILDADGKVLVKYVGKDGKDIRSYDEEGTIIERVGEPILIGNGSTVRVNVSVYPTAMGPGNRLESITLVDLVHYEKPEEETPEEAKEEKTPEVKQKKGATPPW